MVVATKPSTFTLAPFPNRTPLGFMKNRFPFAFKFPYILEGSFDLTLLSVFDDEFG